MDTITGRPAPGAVLLDPSNGYQALPADEDSTVPRNSHWLRYLKRGEFIEAAPAVKTPPKVAPSKANSKHDEDKD
ncbi:MAG: hypothetical protein COB93_00165 [Sneathiella sp.]|nr:MAG: hypothetical protein COB93_00165 [Sneathiella sp.]